MVGYQLYKAARQFSAQPLFRLTLFIIVLRMGLMYSHGVWITGPCTEVRTQKCCPTLIQMTDSSKDSFIYSSLPLTTAPRDIGDLPRAARNAYRWLPKRRFISGAVSR
jgi:hypothetical protein